MRQKKNFHSFLPATLGVVMTLVVSQPLIVRAADLPKGVGPIKEVKLDPLDTAMATKGKELFTGKCSACHKMEERYVGPALKGVTQRRNPVWIMNMMLNPQEMLQSDETAKGLLEEFLVPMTFQNISETESRAVLEYFRHYDEKGDIVTAKPEAPKNDGAKESKGAKKKGPAKENKGAN